MGCILFVIVGRYCFDNGFYSEFFLRKSMVFSDKNSTLVMYDFFVLVVK